MYESKGGRDEEKEEEWMARKDVTSCNSLSLVLAIHPTSRPLTFPDIRLVRVNPDLGSRITTSTHSFSCLLSLRCAAPTIHSAGWRFLTCDIIPKPFFPKREKKTPK